MKCELCNKEISETVYPYHLLRCKVDEPQPEPEVIEEEEQIIVEDKTIAKSNKRK